MAKKKISLDTLLKAGEKAHLQTTSNNEIKVSHAKLLEISLYKIKENPYQPRLLIDKEEIESLANSIEQNGLMQPILVKKIANEEYMLIAGHRRKEAFEFLKKEKIEAIVYDENEINEKELVALSLLENIQRVNLTPMEISISFSQALENGIFTNAQDLAVAIGKSKSFLSKLLSLKNLDDTIIKDLIQNRAIKDVESLYLLQKIKDKDLQVSLYKQYKNGTIGREEIKQSIQNQKITPHLIKENYKLRVFKDKLSLVFDIRKIDEHKKEELQFKLQELLKEFE
jgi:ParB/RepB/Spo0J family partition protein